MSVHLSPETQSRLAAKARAEGVPPDTFLTCMLDEREELSAILERIEAQNATVSDDELRAKIERGFVQSERAETVDGSTFMAGLLREVDEMEHKRHTG